jgi:hypothetical protein
MLPFSFEGENWTVRGISSIGSQELLITIELRGARRFRLLEIVLPLPLRPAELRLTWCHGQRASHSWLLTSLPKQRFHCHTQTTKQTEME